MMILIKRLFNASVVLIFVCQALRHWSRKGHKTWARQIVPGFKNAYYARKDN